MFKVVKDGEKILVFGKKEEEKIENEIERLKKERVSLDQEINEIKRTLKDWQEIRNSFWRKFDEEKKIWQREIEELKKEAEFWKTKKEEEKKEAERESERRGRLLGIIGSLEKEKGFLERQIELKKKGVSDIDSVAKKKEQLRKEIADLLEKKCSLESRLLNLEREILEKENYYQGLKETWNKWRAEIDELRAWQERLREKEEALKIKSIKKILKKYGNKKVVISKKLS
jgi:chromosome segregation ATPase